MYRQIFTPNEHDHVVDIPHEWYGCEIEVIIFPLDKTRDLQKAQIRRDWAEAAQRLHLNGDDKLFMSNMDENTDWWVWDE
jgi:hypothetical protein